MGYEGEYPIAHMFVNAEPMAMAWGMTSEEFWHGRPWLFQSYREAHRISSRERDWERWQLGAYFKDALERVAPILNPFSSSHESEPWLKAPYGVEPPDEEVSDEDAEVRLHSRIINEFAKRY